MRIAIIIEEVHGRVDVSLDLPNDVPVGTCRASSAGKLAREVIEVIRNGLPGFDCLYIIPGDNWWRLGIKADGNPFIGPRYGDQQTFYTDAANRLRCVKDFDVTQCNAALRVPGLQKTVERAIHVRMRKLKREAGL